MATFERHVDVKWQGGLMDGKGEATAGTGLTKPAKGTPPSEVIVFATSSMSRPTSKCPVW